MTEQATRECMQCSWGKLEHILVNQKKNSELNPKQNKTNNNKAEINEIKNRKSIKKIDAIKSWFSENKNQ